MISFTLQVSSNIKQCLLMVAHLQNLEDLCTQLIRRLKWISKEGEDQIIDREGWYRKLQKESALQSISVLWSQYNLPIHWVVGLVVQAQVMYQVAMELYLPSTVLERIQVILLHRYREDSIWNQVWIANKTHLYLTLIYLLEQSTWLLSINHSSSKSDLEANNINKSLDSKHAIQ